MEQVSRIFNEQPPASGESNIASPSIPLDDKRYDRLSAVVAGGNSKKIKNLGKEYTMTEIKNLSVNEIVYSRLISVFIAQ